MVEPQPEAASGHPLVVISNDKVTSSSPHLCRRGRTLHGAFEGAAGCIAVLAGVVLPKTALIVRTSSKVHETNTRIVVQHLVLEATVLRYEARRDQLAQRIGHVDSRLTGSSRQTGSFDPLLRGK